jgi:uncharacterized protein (TIGR03382 family)
VFLLALALFVPCIPADSPAELLGERGGRPVIAGTVETALSDDGGFRVHWTESGDDAPPDQDFDGNGRPDTIDTILATLVAGAGVYADLGYKPVPPDSGAGGDGALDLYVLQINANGFANPDPGPDGMSCYMRIDPDLTSTGSILESVVVHELHHCVQYTYTVDAQSWVYEATATFEQYDQVQSTALQAALDVLWNERLRGADRAFDALDGRFEYAGFLFLKFLIERGEDDRDRARRWWQTLEAMPEWQDALEDFADQEWGEDSAQVLLDFHTWNAFSCARDDGQHYDPSAQPCTFPATSVNVEDAVDGVEVEFESGVHSARYVELPADGDQPVELDCSQDVDGASAWVRLVAVDAAGRSGEQAEVEVVNAAQVRLNDVLDPQGSVLVVAQAGPDAAPNLRCEVERVEPVVPDPVDPPEEQACQCSAGGGGAIFWTVGVLAGLRRRRTRR